MSWIETNTLSKFQKFWIKVLKNGPIPQHIAIIMDGNRRYAKQNNMRHRDGHLKGFEKLSECFHWCRALGVKELTVYAFSIENFKRTKEEVNYLLDLASEKFMTLFTEEEQLMSDGVCVRIIGNLSLLPENLRQIMEAAALLTKNNRKHILNLAICYISREEITHSIRTIVSGVEDGLIEDNDITEELISSCLYTHPSSDPDILIRTSGEVRLSDFLLWQLSESTFYFIEVTWPDFSIWNLLKIIFEYQRLDGSFRKRPALKDPSQKVFNARIEAFFKKYGIERE